MEFWQDKDFLKKLNHYKIRTYSAAIILLDFASEKPIARFEGKVISGSLNIAANSPTRRTGSFSILFDDDTYNYTEANNLLSIDKKISFSIGIANPFYNTDYPQYGDVLWYPQGVFFITQISSSIGMNGGTISINIIDKMGKLNGTCGGVLPATVNFHEKIIIDKDENQTILYPTIKEIIYEAVQHFGGEHASRIIIDDVPDVGRQIVRYVGQTPIHFKLQGDHGKDYIISNSLISGYDEHYYKNNLIGYLETDLTYPGTLIKKPGNTVTQVLDDIVKTLGNYEYFYDVQGNFHFQQIKNYNKTGHTNLNTLDSEDYAIHNLYIPNFTDFSNINDLNDLSLITQLSLSPKFNNIKNDFICWGSKKDSNTSKVSPMVRYHLAIDERPEDSEDALCHKTIYKITDAETGEILRYQTDGTYNSGEKSEKFSSKLDDIFQEENSFNWREELYRKALMAYGSSIIGSEYDEELKAEWRNIYDPDSIDFKTRWEQEFYEIPWYGYTPDILKVPKKIRYWLDIIDEETPFGRYSINRIGKRTVSKENSQINEVFNPEIPDIVFILNKGDFIENLKKAEYYISIGQDYSIIDQATLDLFSLENSFGSCYEEIREMLYNNLTYNTSINLTTIPLFHLDVNQVMRLNFPDYKIAGDYVINTISWQINQNMGTMSIQLNEAIEII